MKCDKCGKDKNFWTELLWNGRYRHFDTFWRIRKKKQYWCFNCLKITKERGK